MTEDVPELTDDDFASAIPARLRRRLIKGQFETGGDIAALRRFVRLTRSSRGRVIGEPSHDAPDAGAWASDPKRLEPLSAATHNTHDPSHAPRARPRRW